MCHTAFSSRHLILPAVVGLALATVAESRAGIVTANRLSYYDITFAQPDFSDASSRYDVYFDAIPDAAGDTRDFPPSLKLNYTNLVTDSTGGVVWTNVVPAADHFNATLLAVDGDPGRMRYGYDSAAVPDFNNVGSFGNSWLEVKNVDGFYALRFGGPFGFRGGGAGIIDRGQFALEIFISGDWSNQGTSADQLEVINFNPLWTIEDNFVYDPVSGKTHFLAYLDDYVANTGEEPLMDFVLRSRIAVVPEPSTLALASFSGLGLLLLSRRRSGR